MPSCPNSSRLRRRRLAPATLVLVAAAAAANAAPRPAAPATAVIERIDLAASETLARLEITLDRELTWSVGRDRDGALALDLPNARPGYGVVSRVLPGGLLAELRIGSVGIPSRPVTRLAIATRGAADHRVAIDGRRLVVELVPTGSPFPEAPEPTPPPEVLAPTAPVEVPAPAPLPAIESEDLAASELAAPVEATAPAAAQPPAISAPEAPREVAPGAVASLPAPAPPVALAPAPAGAAPPLRVLPPPLESAPVPSLAADSGVSAPQPLAPAPAPPVRVLPPAIEAAAVDPLALDGGATEPGPLAPVASPPVRILPPTLAPASVGALDTGAAPAPTPDPLPPGASPPVRIEMVEPPLPPLTASPVEALTAPPAIPAELPAAAAELRILPPPLREVATRLTAVARLAPGVLAVAGNGAFEFTGLRLENPERFVIDLHGVVNQTGLGALDIDEGVVARVRVSQFRSSPVPVTRIIFDLVAPAVPAIEPAADGLLVRFPEVAPRSTAAPPR